jgi:hypothetical protein
LGAVAPLGPAAIVRRRRGGWPRWGSSGLGKGSDTFSATRRTRLWAQNRHGGARERRPRWERFHGGATNSGEQLRGRWGDTWRNKGMGRVLTSSANSGARGGRRRCGGTSGRRRRGSGCAKTAPVSADPTQQGGRGHTEGCPEQVTVRRSSPRHWTGHGRDGGHGTGIGRRRTMVELPARVGIARERARGLGRGRK